MELRQLAYFVAVADEGGFTRAAETLHVAQPGVSAQIRQLERELGQPLFDRSGRAVRLTEVGEAVLPYARAALRAAAGARQAVDELTGLLRGHVVMGAVSVPSVLDLPGLLAGFHELHPAVEITLREAAPRAVADDVLAGRMDLGLLGIGPVVPPGLAGQIVVRQPLVAAVRRDHPLAGRAGIGLTDLDGLAVLCLPPETGVRSSLEAGCAAAGFTPRVAFEASEPRVLAQLAAKGLGVAVLPESAVSIARDELHVIEIIRPRLIGRMALVWRGEGQVGPAARALIGYARRVLPDLGPTG
ncbi:LysR family transcriptional regulator [Nonomuraea indica]|uniref:LysR family transcriptional regulator n=1 Tax=Nonomuraea indica TaxID=1581193 RepID=UPI000C7CE4A9|nr:LysR substrate-binding domain-containing protein [Nonomuraea indica]